MRTQILGLAALLSCNSLLASVFVDVVIEPIETPTQVEVIEAPVVLEECQEAATEGAPAAPAIVEAVPAAVEDKPAEPVAAQAAPAAVEDKPAEPVAAQEAPAAVEDKPAEPVAAQAVPAALEAEPAAPVVVEAAPATAPAQIPAAPKAPKAKAKKPAAKKKGAAKPKAAVPAATAPAAIPAAQQQPAAQPQPTPMPPLRKSTGCYIEDRSRIQIGGTYSYARVEPKGNPITKGNLGGVLAIYEYRPLDSFYGAAECIWRDGTTTGSGTKRTIFEIDAQERFGYTFGISCGKTRFTLFTGVGYRYLGETVTTTSRVSFNYSEFYVPVGMLYDWKCSSWFSWGANFQWMPQVFPTVAIIPLDGANWQLRKRLCNYLVEMPLTFYCTNCFSVMVVPFFESWHDGYTTAKTAGGVPLGVPSNSYHFGGVNLNLGLKF